MEDVQEKKQEIRNIIRTQINSIPLKSINEKSSAIENRLFEFANFVESRIVLLYVNSSIQVKTESIIKKCYGLDKIVVLPAFDSSNFSMELYKVDNPDKTLIQGSRGIAEPDRDINKIVPIDCIDIAIIPCLALDEKGGRIGSGEGYYDRIIPQLPITTRKVGLAFESQIIQQIPMESHDKHIDIIITEKRVIYKI